MSSKILFDSRADHSFISQKFRRKLKLSPHRLNYPVIVEIAGGRNVFFSNKLESVTIDINGNVFRKELLPNEFNVILGMDWLGDNLM